MWGSQRKVFRERQLQKQLETDQRTYGAIGREGASCWAGWKNAPVLDFQAIKADEQKEQDNYVHQASMERFAKLEADWKAEAAARLYESTNTDYPDRIREEGEEDG